MDILKLKSTLSENKWVIQNLVAPVKEQMFHKLGLSQNSATQDQFSLTFLSSSLYKPTGIDSDMPVNKPRPLQVIASNFSHAEYVQNQCHNFFKQAKLTDFENLHPNSLRWIEDFISLCNSSTLYESLTSFLEYAIMLDDVSFKGASHPHFLGSLFLHLRSDDSKFDFLISIIHESAHQELFLINFIDRLIVAEYDHNQIHAPYQNRPRPPIGRLHSAHALFRMIQFTKQFDSKNQKINFFISKFKDNLKSFHNEELTAFSKYLLKEVYEPFAKIL